MIKYYSLQNLLEEGIDIEPIINNILLVTISAKTTYPEYADWFVNKHVPGIYAGTRNTIIAVHKNRIVGVSNVKTSENKLCTLYFNPKYRRHRLGNQLVEESINYLKDSKPLITMPSSYLPQFK
ncbi:MAG: GNAT family N-acetyltransferase, partial [Bacilli bacterium]|nr:GNAT family N-acetyltransferase [Bacilli bacterium]